MLTCRYDAVELFIAPTPSDGSVTQHYIEIELSPNTVLFTSNISNWGGDCSGIRSSHSKI
jgi:hypothetical protein